MLIKMCVVPFYMDIWYHGTELFHESIDKNYRAHAIGLNYATLNYIIVN